MSKSALAGFAVLLSVVAAGAGAFFATRSSQASISAPEPGISVAPERVQGAPVAAAQSGDSAGPGQLAQAGTAPAAPPAGSALPPPAPVPAAAAPAAERKPVQAPAPSRRAPAPKPSAKAPAANPDQGARVIEKPAPAAVDVAPTPAPVAVEPPLSQAQAPPPPPPPEVRYDELVVAEDAVIGLKLESTVNSETARVEDPVEAHVTRDVRVGSRVAIPVGTRVLGSVTLVDKGGKVKTNAKLGVRFHTIVLPDGTRPRIQTDVIYREGDSAGQEAAGKVGAAAAGGALLGAILGGGKGAAIGGSIGAAGGAAAVMTGNRNPAVLQAGTAITVRLLQPVSILVER